MGGIRVLQTHF